jgi:tRNA A-37 threonylcarbamoyl transferase component Bud32
MEKQEQEKVEIVEAEDSVAVRDPLIGSLFAGRYQVQSIVGHGATSTVYRAQDTKSGEAVALKVLHLHLAGDASLVGRFKREAKTASILKHHNIVAVHEYGVSGDGLPYLVMEFVEGTSLQDLLLKDEWLPLSDALPLFEQIGAALMAAHEKGVVHRDIKPGNIMLTKSSDGKNLVKVLDFGCAQVLPMIGDTVLKLTQTGEMLGSLLYMSPEQCLDQDVDERSDCYSLACLMYETVTGKPPLVARTAFETMNKHMTVMPAPFERVRPDLALPERLQEIIFKAMAKAPEKRYQTISDLMDDLSSLSGNRDAIEAREKRLVAKEVAKAAAKAAAADLTKASPEKLRQAILGLYTSPAGPFAETADVRPRHYILAFIVVVVPMLVFVIAFFVGLIPALLVLAAMLLLWAGLGLVSTPKERSADQNNVLLKSYEDRSDAIVKAANRFNVSIVSASRQKDRIISLEVNRVIEPDSNEVKTSHNLLIEPPKKEDDFWQRLCTERNAEMAQSALPLPAAVLLDDNEQILAIISGAHLALVEASFVI